MLLQMPLVLKHQISKMIRDVIVVGKNVFRDLIQEYKPMISCLTIYMEDDIEWQVIRANIEKLTFY